ncbi:haloacid dehalogenase type II [Shewanella sp. HL-SH4]|uniref:haloacid dehalogenase type II n=1 Tax=Shewanella sp. HL-SH4 TaxID=3436240 RepID=UPI003EB87464
MTKTLAFDVYGTLIDTHGVVALLIKMFKQKTLERETESVIKQAYAFSQTWRDKQLEYSFRRGLMQQYKEFSICTRDALEYTCQFHTIPLTNSQKCQLLESYLTLPAFDDVAPALQTLKEKGISLFAFSNGEYSAVESLLKNANILAYFEGIVSCEAIMTFKPNPAVYEYFIQTTNSMQNEVWLISSNSFDILGAAASGFKTAWVKRSPQMIFDPWGVSPTQTVTDLAQLDTII